MISEDREVLTELLSHFKEQIDAKISDIESTIYKNIQTDWAIQQNKIIVDQETRNRNVVMEILGTTKKFKQQVNKKFETWRQEDEAELI